MTVTPEIHLFEFKVAYSVTFDYTKLNLLDKKLCSMNCGWLKETWQYVTIHGTDKYNTMFQNVTRALCQNKTHTKIS